MYSSGYVQENILMLIILIYRGCLLTSSLVGTLSLSLVSPLSITYSIFVADVSKYLLF